MCVQRAIDVGFSQQALYGEQGDSDVTGLTTCPPGCPGRSGVRVLVVVAGHELPRGCAVKAGAGTVSAGELHGERPQVFTDCSGCSPGGPSPPLHHLKTRFKSGKAEVLSPAPCESSGWAPPLQVGTGWRFWGPIQAMLARTQTLENMSATLLYNF